MIKLTGKPKDQDSLPGFTQRPVFSEIGSGVGGFACAVGQSCILWAVPLLRDAPLRDLEIGYMTMMSVPVAVIGLFIGAAAGGLAHPITSTAVGAFLSGLPGCCCWNFFAPSDNIVDVLPTWISMVVAGGLSGWIGGFVGQRHLRRKIEPLEPALEARENAEQMKAEKEAAEMQAEQAAREIERCLSCGHVMESHVTCPNCGWTYL